jgi:hypothetical protein
MLYKNCEEYTNKCPKFYNPFNVYLGFERKEPESPKEFVVSLVNTYPYWNNRVLLLELMLKHMSLKNTHRMIEGTYIVFTKNEVYLETSSWKAAMLELPILSLTEYSKVEKTVKNFFSEVYSPVKTKCDECPYNKNHEDFSVLDIILELGETKKKENKKDTFYNGETVLAERRLHICKDGVIVGEEIYPIAHEIIGNPFIGYSTRSIVTIDKVNYQVVSSPFEKDYIKKI